MNTPPVQNYENKFMQSKCSITSHFCLKMTCAELLGLHPFNSCLTANKLNWLVSSTFFFFTYIKDKKHHCSGCASSKAK